MDRPQYPAITLGVYAQYSIARAYALVRLKKLEGFMATTYVKQWPDAKAEEPEWRPAGTFGLLHTCEIQLKKSQAEWYSVLPETWWIFPLLRAVARALQNPNPGLKQEAQEALVTFLREVRDLGHFLKTSP